MRRTDAELEGEVLLLQKNKSHTYEPHLFAGDGKETELFLSVFGKKRNCGTRDEVRAVFPKRFHSSRAWDDYEVAFVFTTYVSCVWCLMMII